MGRRSQKSVGRRETGGKGRRVKKAPVPKALAVSRSNTLVNKLKPNEAPVEAMADMLVSGLVANAVTAVQFSKSFDGVDLTACVAKLHAAVGRVQRGDLREPEALLTAQAVALNSIFSSMAQRAAMNTGEYLDATDRYMRLALKAQGQCRATLETLATVKNPPVVFARQANIAQGPQQVNNAVSLERCDDEPTRAAKRKNRANRTIRRS